MKPFEDLFIDSEGEPFRYNGLLLHMYDDYQVEHQQAYQLTIEETNSEWRQGVSLKVDGKGEIITCGQKLTHCVFWENTAPHTVDFRVSKNTESLVVKNVWDTGDGVMESWHNCAAMLIEPLHSGFRYRCNDGFADDDFDDIIFRIEKT